MKQSARSYKRIVVKIGSSLFYEGKELRIEGLYALISHIGSLIKKSHEVVIVSSGAIALGMKELACRCRPSDVPTLQATAAVGQRVLMDNYSAFFEKEGLRCAQVLLTWDDFDNRTRYLNAKNTLVKLLQLGVVPVINENDTVSTEEIKFGDNDRLSSLVANLVSADLLIILSDVDGLLDRERKVIPVVDAITPQIRALACPTDKKTCVGGMITKLEAAKIAIESGVACVIANGRRERIVDEVVAGLGGSGTLFIPQKGFLDARERWIAFGTKPKGKIIIDEGAKNALLNRKSLLSVGIVEVEGNFKSGDIVSIVDRGQIECARGKVSFDSVSVRQQQGKRFQKEIIHRDNIVLIAGVQT
ncbi:MAG: glutamate 5-kinase [Candidatus Omnitrophica bacterium]|nr:glutamate 5-kinase [Candidatus Omnitrophota bacterium]